MKRFMASIVAAAAAAASFGSIAVYAEENPVLEMVGTAVYSQLVEQSDVDMNDDNTVTLEELRTAERLQISLDSVSSLSWLTEMNNLEHIILSGGENPDLSVLSQLPNLRNVQLSRVGTDDISFAENLNLDMFFLYDMENITLEQRLKTVRFGDHSTERGFTTEIGVFPRNILDGYDVKLYIDDTNTAAFHPGSWSTDEKGEYIRSANTVIYGKSAGTTEYTIEIDGQEMFSGKIDVSEPDVQEFPAVGNEEYCSETTYSNFYGDKSVVISGGKLYGIMNGRLYLYEKNVEKFRHVYYNSDSSDFWGSDGIILSDGTFKINGQAIENPYGAKFVDAMNYYLLDENGRIYAIEINSGIFSAKQIGENCREFIEDSSFYAVSNDGEIMYIKNRRTDDGMKYTVLNTGIMNCISMKNDYFVDENNVLWEVIRYGNEPSVKKKAEDVVFVGYRWYDNGMVNGCVHITSDGTAYSAGSNRKVELYEKAEHELYCKEYGYFMIEGMIGGASDDSDNINYAVTNDNELSLDFNGTRAFIPDVACYISGVTNGESAEVCFIRTDNTIWKYNLPDCTYTQLIAEEPPKTTEFDVNGDGFFTIADGTALESYLLKGVKPANLAAADINHDDSVDIFDFVLMRKKLIEKNIIS